MIKDLDLSVSPGSMIALVGRTGSGKSTLVDIIMGLLSPIRGELFYGNEKIGPENIESYRGRIGYVPQTIILIDDSIAANIAFGVPENERDERRMAQAIKSSQLDDFIQQLPDGLETIVGERGVRLSGGQRQRIGIARAIYRDPEILVLDEATSALDPQTEECVYRSIKERKKMVVMVTHRPRGLEFSDMIYVLENGAILEQGTFEELKKKPGLLENSS